jgi:IS1 family transposase
MRKLYSVRLLGHSCNNAVLNQKNKVYVWLAIDRDTWEIVGCYVGDKTRKFARKLWRALPSVYRQCAVTYTDFWEAYVTIIPRKRHRPVGKETGQTNHIERLNDTFRQRISRLVRKSLSFSKKMDNHIDAIWYFIHDYNAHLEKVWGSPLLADHYRERRKGQIWKGR